SVRAKELHSLGVSCTSVLRGEMTASDEARRWRSSPQRVSPGTVTTGTHAATPPRNRCVGAAAEGSRPTDDRCTLGTPDDRQAASRVSGAAVHVRTQTARKWGRRSRSELAVKLRGDRGSRRNRSAIQSFSYATTTTP